ncbi:MAG: signal peptidase I [Acidobacteria bacterium]|nr:signal peptidase I [Acidobacteriota bacterium]
MLDAGQPQDALNRAAPAAQRGERSLSRSPIGWLRDVVVAIALALLIIAFVYQPVKVEGTSMAPHLVDQQRIFVNKFVYKFEPIERGDIVVFRYPIDPRKSFIKRVVGLPGELVEIRGGRVLINGQPLREEYVPAEESDHDDFPPLRLPANHYFVLGDHRRSSNDSRTWGTVHRQHIYGKAVFAYWPPERFGPIETTNGTK